jgi:hypothetical protein
LKKHVPVVKAICEFAEQHVYMPIKTGKLLTIANFSSTSGSLLERMQESIVYENLNMTDSNGELEDDAEKDEDNDEGGNERESKTDSDWAE